jgi:hypothetical protein
MVVNAIRACDNSRPVISGMHSLELDGVWNIQDQAQTSDILTTHPYPFWVEHCQQTALDSYRTLLHATAQTRYYASVGQKPCLVEELGSMGPMNADDETAAGFLRVNLWSNWAHGAPGVLWWCAFDQSHLDAPPYDWNMCERELGMAVDTSRPKPVMHTLKNFGWLLNRLDLTLPPPQTDGVCILSWGQDHWGAAYMSFALAKQAGLTLNFTYCDQPLPDSPLYFLPSVHMDAMSKHSYAQLKEKVRNGATLYLSVRDGIFTEFEALTGFRVKTAAKSGDAGWMLWNNCRFERHTPHQFLLEPTRAQVLAENERGEPVFGVAPYGAGAVYFLNFPLEEMLLTMPQGFAQGYHTIYEAVAASLAKQQDVRKADPFVGITLHDCGEQAYAVLVNYSPLCRDAGLSFAPTATCVETVCGDPSALQPYDGAIIRYRKNPMQP